MSLGQERVAYAKGILGALAAFMNRFNICRFECVLTRIRVDLEGVMELFECLIFAERSACR